MRVSLLLGLFPLTLAVDLPFGIEESSKNNEVLDDGIGQIMYDDPSLSQFDNDVEYDDIGAVVMSEDDTNVEYRGLRTERELTNLKKVALDAHNKARSSLDTPCTAANMRELVWDSDLAKVAQDYAEKCVWKHNSNRPKGVGENMAVRYSSKDLDVSADAYIKSVAMWMAEGKYYNYQDGSCSKTPCGHYTQVVWADTTKVGCGVARCKNGLEGGVDYMNGVVVVCNYDPAGNIVGRSPYIEGQQCALCKDSCSNGMCTRPVDKVKWCKDYDYKYNWNNVKYEGCDKLLKGAGKGVCNEWPVIGSTYCRKACETCSEKDHPKGVGNDFCGPPEEYSKGGDDGSGDGGNGDGGSGDGDGGNDGGSNDGGNNETGEDGTKCEDLTTKRDCKDFKNDKGKKLCKFKKKKCIAKRRRL